MVPRVLCRCGVIAGWLLLVVAPALAEPYFAVREGLPCSACHVNMNGGGMRTDLVSTHARDILHYPNFFGAFSNPPEFFTGEINKFVSIGSDLRASYTAVFQDLGSNQDCSAAIQAQSSTVRCVDNNKVFRDRLESNSIDVNEAELYGHVRLIPDYLSFYIDEQFQPTTTTREVFGLLRGILPWNGYFKAGRMFLPYGLQLQQDQAFIRGGRTNGSSSISTGFSFNTQEPAFEIGFEPGPLTLVTAVSKPSGSSQRDVRTTSTASALFTDVPVVRNVLVGGSFSYVGLPDGESWLFGFFGGSNIERLTFLGEVDFLNDKNQMTNGRTIGRFIAYGEGDYLLFGWMNVKANGEYSDNDGTLGDTSDSENAVSFGVEPFLNRFLQLRLFYQINNGISTNPTHNQNVLLAEVHLFF
jgi:hypothetical protein